MKAVLVIDMPDDIDISKVKIGGDGNIYYIRDGERASIIGNIKNIKPLPEECDDATEIYNAHGEIDCYQLTEYARGYNACLKEIMGD